MGSILGGIFGGGESPGQQAQMAGIKASRDDLARYRPEAMQAALNAISNTSTAYQPSNNALETLWGAPQGGKQTPMQHLTGGFGDMPAAERAKMAAGPQAPPPQVGTDPRYVAPRPTSGGGFDPMDPLGIFSGGGIGSLF